MWRAGRRAWREPWTILPRNRIGRATVLSYAHALLLRRNKPCTDRVNMLGSLILLPIAHWFSIATIGLIGLLLTFSPILIAVWKSFRYLRRL